MKWIIGVDEVGRGPLAGPVCVCAAAMPVSEYKKRKWKLNAVTLTDSKKMTAKGRTLWSNEALRMKKNNELRFGIAMKSAAMIDQKGISTCIRSCIQTAIEKLSLDPNDCVVFLDGGLKAPIAYRKQETVIRGDSKHRIISMASVIAKVHRDTYMEKLHKTNTVYAWNENKGYGTLMHRKAIRRHGASPMHRKSFISKVIS